MCHNVCLSGTSLSRAMNLSLSGVSQVSGLKYFVLLMFLVSLLFHGYPGDFCMWKRVQSREVSRLWCWPIEVCICCLNKFVKIISPKQILYVYFTFPNKQELPKNSQARGCGNLLTIGNCHFEKHCTRDTSYQRIYYDYGCVIDLPCFTCKM